MALLGCIYVVSVILGHGALHVYLHNRINATGLPRRALKRIEKSFLLHFVLLPMVLLPIDGMTILQMLKDIRHYNDLSWYSKVYSPLMVVVLVALLPKWIVGRIEYWRQARRQSLIQSSRLDLTKELGKDLFKPKWLQQLARFPGNQIGQLEITTKEIVIPNMPQAWSGLRIAHLSDLHMIDWYDKRFVARAFQEIRDLNPDLCIVAGDLVDRTRCLADLCKVMKPMAAPLGNYFVLGNHDTRVDDPDDVRRRLQEMGWFDLGTACHEIVDHKNDRTLQLLGNERPWFDTQSRNISERDLMKLPSKPNCLRIAVSHNPDQWKWALMTGCMLTLCGHTHGGQIRMPLIGPVIAPSWHGSRYASGIFVKNNSVMHVSRGLSGTQPLRINCRPEASLLIVR